MTKGDQKSNREKRKPKADQKTTGKKLPSYMSGDSGLGSLKGPGMPAPGGKGRK